MVEVDSALGPLLEKLQARIPQGPEDDQRGCFLCKWILEDLNQSGKLTDGHPPKSVDGSSQFPAESKKKHLALEGLWSDSLQFIVPEAAGKVAVKK